MYGEQFSCSADPFFSAILGKILPISLLPFTELLKWKPKFLQTSSLKFEIILKGLESLKTDIKFISNKEEDYFKDVVEESSFFYRVYRSSIKLFVIDICKLLNPDEHFSIIKTTDYAISNWKRINWEREAKIARLKILKERIEKLNLEQLKDFKELRDKHFAHNDKKKHEFESKVTLVNCWQSLKISRNI